MSRYVSDEIRLFVIQRSGNLCEYCLMHEQHFYLKGQIDHIISVKHGGKTILTNLAYACIHCNRNKGSDVATITIDNKTIRFYNPRIDIWSEHFTLIGTEIIALTEIGQATVKILELNSLHRLLERQALIEDGLFPPQNAQIHSM
jgi:hypothetical protein